MCKYDTRIVDRLTTARVQGVQLSKRDLKRSFSTRYRTQEFEQDFDRLVADGVIVTLGKKVILFTPFEPKDVKESGFASGDQVIWDAPDRTYTGEVIDILAQDDPWFPGEIRARMDHYGVGIFTPEQLRLAVDTQDEEIPAEVVDVEDAVGFDIATLRGFDIGDIITLQGFSIGDRVTVTLNHNGVVDVVDEGVIDYFKVEDAYEYAFINGHGWYLHRLTKVGVPQPGTESEQLQDQLEPIIHQDTIDNVLFLDYPSEEETTFGTRYETEEQKFQPSFYPGDRVRVNEDTLYRGRLTGKAGVIVSVAADNSGRLIVMFDGSFGIPQLDIINLTVGVPLFASMLTFLPLEDTEAYDTWWSNDSLGTKLIHVMQTVRESLPIGCSATPGATEAREAVKQAQKAII